MRRSKGSAITEFGPSLFILLVVIFVPLLALFYIAVGYGFAYFLHNLEIREVATNPPNITAGTQALTRADTDFVNNSCGIAQFLGINSGNYTAKVTHPGFGASSYAAPPAGVGNITPGTVTLTTNVSIRPWLDVPFLAGLPGVGAPLNLSFTDTKPEDENGQN